MAIYIPNTPLTGGKRNFIVQNSPVISNGRGSRFLIFTPKVRVAAAPVIAAASVTPTPPITDNQTLNEDNSILYNEDGTYSVVD